MHVSQTKVTVPHHHQKSGAMGRPQRICSQKISGSAPLVSRFSFSLALSNHVLAPAGAGRAKQVSMLWATVVQTASAAALWTRIWRHQKALICFERVLPALQAAIRKALKKKRLDARVPAFKSLQKAATAVTFPTRMQMSLQNNATAANILLSTLHRIRHPLFRWHFASQRLFHSIQAMQRLWHGYKLATACRMSMLAKVWDEVEVTQLKHTDESKQRYIRNILAAASHNQAQAKPIAAARNWISKNAASEGAQQAALPYLAPKQAHFAEHSSRKPNSSGAKLQRPTSAISKKHLLLQSYVHSRHQASYQPSQMFKSKYQRPTRPLSAQPKLQNTKVSQTSPLESMRNHVLYATKHGIIDSRTGHSSQARRLKDRMHSAEPKVRTLAELIDGGPRVPGQQPPRSKAIGGVPSWLTGRGVVYVPNDARRGKMVACGFAKQPVPKRMRNVLLRRFLTIRRREYAQKLRQIREANLQYARKHAMSLTNGDSRFILEQPKDVVAAAIEFHMENALKLKPVATPPLLIVSRARKDFPQIIRDAITAGMAERETFLAHQPKVARSSQQTHAELRKDTMPTLSLSHQQVADIVENLHRGASAEIPVIDLPGSFRPEKLYPIPNVAETADLKQKGPVPQDKDVTAETDAKRLQTRRDSTASSSSAVPVWEAPLAAIAWRTHHMKKRPLNRGQSFSKFASPQVMKLAAKTLQNPPHRSVAGELGGMLRTTLSIAAPAPAVDKLRHNAGAPANQRGEGEADTKSPSSARGLNRGLTVNTDIGMADYNFDSASTPHGDTATSEVLRRTEIRRAIEKHRRHIARGSAMVSKLAKQRSRAASSHSEPEAAAGEAESLTKTAHPGFKAVQQAAKKLQQINGIWRR